MLRSKSLLWLGSGLLASALLVGCRNNRRYECCECSIQPVAHAPVVETKTQQASHLPPVRKEIVHVTAVAPGSSYSNSAVVGTVEMTASEAEAIGIRPGVTPGALYVQGSAPPAIVNIPTEPKSVEPALAEPRIEEPSLPPLESPPPTVIEKRADPSEQ